MFLLGEGDPSYLQTSAGSDLSVFGMTGYFGVKCEEKKRRAAAVFWINEEWYFCGSPLLFLCHSAKYLSSRCEARDPYLLSAFCLFADVMKD